MTLPAILRRGFVALALLLAAVAGSPAQENEPAIEIEPDYAMELEGDFFLTIEPDEWRTQQTKVPPFVSDRSDEREVIEDGGDRILFGDPTPAYAETVKVRFNGNRLCTGVLIDWNHVLTAGHCGCGIDYEVEFSLKDPDRRVFGPIVGQPARYRNFRCGIPASNQPGTDLALLTIDIEGTFTTAGGSRVSIDNLRGTNERGVRPAAITGMLDAYFANATSLRAVGYGKTETGDLSDGRRDADINVLSFFCSTGAVIRSRCAPFREFALSNVVSAGLKPSDTCSGDSGGPIFMARAPDAAPPLYALVGITSRELSGVQHLPGLPCGGGGLYTAVGHSDVHAWLEANGVEATYVP